MDSRTCNAIAGIFSVESLQSAGPSDHSITSDERAFALEIAAEIAERAGLDLAAHVAAHHARLEESDHAQR